MLTIDLNADVGEGMAADGVLIPLISSANIACGYHAGNEQLMRQTVRTCKQYGIAVGAHPSFPDRDNFGRTEMDLPLTETKELVITQLNLLQDICKAEGVHMHHVKPHGALYNMCARNFTLAGIVAEAVAEFDNALFYYGMAGTCMIDAAEEAGLSTVAEFFADRRYDANGKLLSRTLPNALINDEYAMLAQARQIILERQVTTADGRTIKLAKEIEVISICLHGDGDHAISFAQSIRQLCKSLHVKIEAP